MHYRLLLILVFILLSHSAKCDLRVMSLNAEWLWTPHDGRVEGSKFNRGDLSKSDYAEEIEFYAAMIQSNGIDLLAISEIENQSVAVDLARQIGKDWKAHYVQGRDTATGQDVALLSHLHLVEGSLTNFNFPCGKAPKASKHKCLSKVVAATFSQPKGEQRDIVPVSVISAHFLSKRNESRKKRQKRLSQAYALTNAIKQLESNYQQHGSVKLIALGDFNDHYHSDTVKHLRKIGGLKGALDCQNDVQELQKRRLNSIDHVLFKGFECVEEYTVPTFKFSDHDAVVTVLK